MNWDLIMALTGLMLLAYWFTYVAGGPLSSKPDDIDGGAFLIAIPYRMAVRRLARAGMWKSIKSAYLDELAVTSNPKTRAEMKKDHKAETIVAAREMFTWERSILCPICLHFWLTVLVGLVFILFDIMQARADFFLAAFVYLVNHFIIRKIS